MSNSINSYVLSLKIFLRMLIDLGRHLKPDVFSTLTKEGIILKDFGFTPDTCFKLMSLVDELCKTHAKRVSHDGKESFDVNFVDIKEAEKLVPSELLKIDEVTKALQDSLPLGAKLKFLDCRFYFTENAFNPRCFHVDTFYQAQYKAFTYLNDMSSENGPYCYVKGSHRHFHVKMVNLFYNLFNKFLLTDMRKMYPHAQDHMLLFPPGQTFITDQRGAHKGYPQKEGFKRYVLVHNYVVE